MSAFKIGVMSDSFRLSPREGIKKAKEVGAAGIQIYATKGEISAEAMDAAARVDFKNFVADQGLEISALCGCPGGHGFQDAAENKTKIAKSKAIVDLAVDVGTSVVTTHIGVVPTDNTTQTYAVMREACHELGEYAAAKGVTFAIETGPEKAVTLKGFLDAVGSKGIGVNLDPANLWMVLLDDPAAAVRTLRDYIVHTHAKDGINLHPCNPVQIYGGAAEAGLPVEESDIKEFFREVPLGEGGVKWDEYLTALREIGFEGYLTIEREVGDDPAADIGKAVEFLRTKLGD